MLAIHVHNYIDVLFQQYGQTPLHDAALSGHDIIAGILLEHRASPDVVDEVHTIGYEHTHYSKVQARNAVNT